MAAPLATAPNPANMLLGRGKIFADRLSLVNGVWTRTGEIDLGNCTEFSITPKAEVKEKFESMDANSLLYGRAALRQTQMVKIQGDEYSLFNLAAVLMGKQNSITNTGATITGETLTTAPVLGAYYSLANRNITPTLPVPVQSAASTATTGGTLLAGTWYYKVTATNSAGETIASNEISQVTTGTTSTVTLNWALVAGATGYKVYRGATPGGENTYFTIASGSTITYTDTGTAGTAGSPPATNSASTFTLFGGPSGTTTKALGTDYTIDATSGRVQILATGTILTTDTVKVNYTFASYTFNTVQGGTQSQVNLYIRFKGAPVQGPVFEVECWNVMFTPNGSLGLIHDDYGNWTIEGMCIYMPSYTTAGGTVVTTAEPLYRMLQVG